MRWLVLSVVTLLAMSTMPTTTAGGSDKHWNGYVLDRSSVKNHVLIDQNYDYYSLQTGSHDVVVVAFIFTTKSGNYSAFLTQIYLSINSFQHSGA